MEKVMQNKIDVKDLEKYPVPTLISNFYKKFITFDI